MKYEFREGGSCGDIIEHHVVMLFVFDYYCYLLFHPTPFVKKRCAPIELFAHDHCPENTCEINSPDSAGAWSFK